MVTGYTSELAAAYAEHRHSLYRVVYARLKGAGLQADVEDVISSAIAELIERPKEGVRNWEAYLVTVVTRRAIDRIRSAEISHRSGVGVELQEVLDERDDYVEVDEGMDTLSALEAVTAILETVDELHQQVAREYFWMERNQTDIAHDLGVSQGRVSQMIQEFRQIVRERMQREVTQ